MANKKPGAVHVRAAGLAVARGDRLLLSGLDFDLAPGDALLLTGPNGIGKTSLLRVFAALLPSFAGDLHVDGAVAFADRVTALDDQARLGDALAFWARIDHGAAAAQETVAAALKAMGLGDLADIPVHMLSTGQARRATLARLLVRNADIWLLDEPANGLDSESLARLGTAMTAHRACGGIVIAASHQPLPLDEPRFCDLMQFRAAEMAE